MFARLAVSLNMTYIACFASQRYLPYGVSTTGTQRLIDCASVILVFTGFVLLFCMTDQSYQQMSSNQMSNETYH